MKLSYIKKACCYLLVAASLSSCQKYIDLEPENSTYDEVFWKDAENISKATNGAYFLLRNALRMERSYFIFGDIAAGNFKVGGDHWNMTSFSKSGNFNFHYAPYLESALWNWTRFYEIINQANRIIENTPLIPDENFSAGAKEKNALIAEAHFIRAYVNFYMQRVWGDVLLIKESYKDPQNIPPVARSSQKETMEFCIADLKFAIDNLDNNTKTKASKGAAQALLAHVYAWQHDYVNAEILSTDVINGGYSLESSEDVRNIWAGGSKESIFELNMLYSESGGENDRNFFNIFLTDPVVKGKGKGSAWTLDVDFKEGYFKDAEARFDSVFRKGDGSSEFYLRKYDNVKYFEPGRTDIYAVSNNLVIYRLADIYLLRAESYFKNGKTQLALDDLNRIRERAGLEKLATAGSDLFTEIFKERRRELIGEGSAQFDVIRMGFLNKLEFEDYYSESRINAQGYYWPLDMRALLPQDELLTQNPWWKNN